MSHSNDVTIVAHMEMHPFFLLARMLSKGSTRGLVKYKHDGGGEGCDNVPFDERGKSGG